MNMVNQEKYERLSPRRMQHAKDELSKINAIFEQTDTDIITIQYKGTAIEINTYTGMYRGRSVPIGRGIKNLIKTIKDG